MPSPHESPSISSSSSLIAGVISTQTLT
jgi:hypothetical protein